MSAPLTLLALLIEITFGYPDRLSRSIGHPVTWMGRLISWLEQRLNRGTDPETRRRAGAVTALVLLLVVGFAAFLIEWTLLPLPFGIIAVAIVASTLLAQRSLFIHVAGVADALDEGGVAAGREAVAHVVGGAAIHSFATGRAPGVTFDNLENHGMTCVRFHALFHNVSHDPQRVVLARVAVRYTYTLVSRCRSRVRSMTLG